MANMNMPLPIIESTSDVRYSINFMQLRDRLSTTSQVLASKHLLA